VETPRKFITAKFSGSSSVLIIDRFRSRTRTSKTTWKWRVVPMYGYATPFWRHFQVVFDIRVLDLNLSNITDEVYGLHVVWFTLVKLVEISQYVLRNIRRITRKPSKINLLCPWLTYLDLQPSYKMGRTNHWYSHNFSRKMTESIEIEKHNNIGGKATRSLMCKINFSC
jgi:hypothetical protein